MPEQQTHVQVLRLFGPELHEVTPVLRRAAAEGCPGLRLGQRDGEYAVCIQAHADTQQQAREICSQWQQQLSTSFGPALFGLDTVDLAQAAASALAGARKLLVAADPAAGQLLEQQLGPVDLGRAVFDFGAQSYADPKQAPRMQELPAWAKKTGNAVTRAAGRAQQTLRITQADYAAALVPASQDHPTVVLLCGAARGWMRVLPQDASAGLAANWLLDMARRAADLLPMPASVQTFRMGKALPDAEPQEAPPVQQTAEQAAPPPAQREEAPAPQPAAQEAQTPPQEHPQPAPAPSMPQAARTLYGLEEPSEPQVPDAPQAHHRHRALWLVLSILLALAVAAAGALAVARFGSGPVVQPLAVPDFEGYGTVDFDTAVFDYLQQARERDAGVEAFLALSGQPGALVYGPQGSSRGGRPGTVQADGPRAPAELVQFSPQADLDAAHHNSLVQCPRQAMEQLSGLDQLEVLRDNSGFTLYQDGRTYPCKVVSVFPWDPADQGDAALVLPELQDLTSYNSYLEFVLGIKARSLFDLPVDIRDSDCFVTLVCEPDGPDHPALAVVGRMQRPDENARLERSAVLTAANPLHTPEEYQAMGRPMPSMDQVTQYWMNWYMTQGQTANDLQEDQGMPQEDLQLEELLAQIDQAAAQAQQIADTPLPKPRPADTQQDAQAGEDGAGGTAGQMPGVDVPIPVTPPAPVQPQETPQPQDPQEPGEPDRNEGPEIEGGSTAPTVTLRVTMNGTRQEMDVVECLAMIAQNELGYNQPAEAYKAQAVAAHSWILTQGSYPSVSGVPATDAVRAAVAQVAGQVLTYNGCVAFTPYFASAAYGTCPSEEVWGSPRPYLVGVESPYDKDVATHWETTREYTRAEVQQRVQEKLGIDLDAYSADPAVWMGDLQKNAGGYVTQLRVGDTHISGGKLRTVVLRDVPGRKNLRSSAFDVAYDPQREVFVFTVRGYGHGCGMSQFGAIGYAQHGASYIDILMHYYPGTQLSPI